jgi:hypothetical protein
MFGDGHCNKQKSFTTYCTKCNSSTIPASHRSPLTSTHWSPYISSKDFSSNATTPLTRYCDDEMKKQTKIGRPYFLMEPFYLLPRYLPCLLITRCRLSIDRKIAVLECHRGFTELLKPYATRNFSSQVSITPLSAGWLLAQCRRSDVTNVNRTCPLKFSAFVPHHANTRVCAALTASSHRTRLCDASSPFQPTSAKHTALTSWCNAGADKPHQTASSASSCSPPYAKGFMRRPTPNLFMFDWCIYSRCCLCSRFHLAVLDCERALFGIFAEAPSDSRWRTWSSRRCDYRVWLWPVLTLLPASSTSVYRRVR